MHDALLRNHWLLWMSAFSPKDEPQQSISIFQVETMSRSAYPLDADLPTKALQQQHALSSAFYNKSIEIHLTIF